MKNIKVGMALVKNLRAHEQILLTGQVENLFPPKMTMHFGEDDTAPIGEKMPNINVKL